MVLVFRWKPVLTLLGIALIIASSLESPSLASDHLPDLVVNITGPSSADAGEPIGGKVTVTVDNLGSVTAPGTTPDGARHNPLGYTLEIVLSSDDDAPIRPSVYQSKFREDVQLGGGSISNTPDVSPNFMLTLWEVGPHNAHDLQIPQDTPSGRYFVCAIVDPRKTVDEADESNNVDCASLSVVGSEPDPGPITEPPSPSPAPPDPATTSENIDEPIPLTVPELANPITRLTVYEDDPDLTVDLSGLLGDEYAPVDWVTVRSNDNPQIVAAAVARGEVVLQFAKDRHGAARIAVDGVDEDGFLFSLSLFLDIEPTNDPPVLRTALGETRLQAGDGDFQLDLLQVFHDVDLLSNQDRLTFKLTNDNTALLSFSLQDSDLTVHPQPNQHGEANLTITATDQWGLSAMDTLLVVVDPPETPVTQPETREPPAQVPPNEMPTNDSDDAGDSVAGPETLTPDAPPQDQQALTPTSDSTESDSPEDEITTPVVTAEPEEAISPITTIGDEVVPVAAETTTENQTPLELDEPVGEPSPPPSPIITSSPTPSAAPLFTSLPPAPAFAAPLPSPPTSILDTESAPRATPALTPVPDQLKAFPSPFPASVPSEVPPQPEVVTLAPTADSPLISGPALIALIALASVGALAVTALAIRIRRRAES